MGAVINIGEEDFSHLINTEKVKNETFIKFLNIYQKDDLKDLKTLIIKDEIKKSRWNFHLVAPLIPNGKVYIHPNQIDVDEKFIRIIHSEHNCVAIFHKCHFFDPTEVYGTHDEPKFKLDNEEDTEPAN